MDEAITHKSVATTSQQCACKIPTHAKETLAVSFCLQVSIIMHCLLALVGQQQHKRSPESCITAYLAADVV